MIGIHDIHRQLATVVWMNTDINGTTVLGPAEIKQLMPLLRENMKLIREMDELKQLSFVVSQLGDTEWQHEVCAKIEALEAKLV